jgi:uncharacterized protein (TIRG00374 family)
MRIDKKLIASLGVSAVFIVLAVSKVDFGETWRSMRHADYVYVLPSAAAVIASLFIRAVRWRLLLSPMKSVPIKSLFAATMMGAMGNNVLPARLGEVVRADAIGRRESLSRSASFATIVVERMIDLFTVLVFLGVVVVYVPFPSEIKTGGYTMLLVSLAALAFLLFLRTKTSSALKVLRFFCRPFPEKLGLRIERLMMSFVDGLEILTRARHMPAIAILSVLTWLAMTGSIVFMFKAFGMSQLSIDAAVVVLVATAFGVMIPAAPGFVGTFHVSCQLALAIYGVDRASALAYSIVLHATQWVPVTAIGLAYFVAANLSFKDLERIETKT